MHIEIQQNTHIPIYAPINAERKNTSKQGETRNFFNRNIRRMKTTSNERAVLERISKAVNRHGYACIAAKTIAEDLGICRKTVYRAIASLKDKGILYAEKGIHRRTKGNGACKYWPYNVKEDVEARVFRETVARETQHVRANCNPLEMGYSEKNRVDKKSTLLNRDSTNIHPIQDGNDSTKPQHTQPSPMPCDGVWDGIEISYPGKGNTDQGDTAEECQGSREGAKVVFPQPPKPRECPGQEGGRHEKQGIYFPGKGRVKPTRIGSHPSLPSFEFAKRSKKPPIPERHKLEVDRPKTVKIKSDPSRWFFSPERQEELMPGSYELWKRRQKIKN